MDEQYEKIKNEYPDYIVLFRLGDFFEAFNEDAINLSKVLGITLTSRGKDQNKKPMAGLPHHALPTYLPKLTKAGLKIAIADQVEEATPGKLVERRITKLITPGTVMDENALAGNSNNYLLATIITKNKSYAAAYADLTTGKLETFLINDLSKYLAEIKKISPSEIIVPESLFTTFKSLGLNVEGVEEAMFEEQRASECVKSQFEIESLGGLGLDHKEDQLRCIGGLIKYLQETQKTDLKHIKKIEFVNHSDYMSLDPETIRNLELLYTISDFDGDETTVLNRLDNCVTMMGKRRLRTILLNPLVNEKRLKQRLDTVDFFFQNRILAEDLRSNLKKISDFERIIGRVGVSSANPKDLRALSVSLSESLAIFQKLSEQEDLSEYLLSVISLPAVRHGNQFSDKAETKKSIIKVIDIINKAILENPAAVVNEGGIILDGYNAEVDELRNLQKNAKSILLKIQQDEIASTGISSLKISYNRVFGYYIEVTRTHIHKVPDHYIRKQTLANAERFITQELKELEDKILSSEEKLITLEFELFKQIRDQVAVFSKDILSLADLIANLDVLVNFGINARNHRYVKPELTSENILEIENGRHIVVESITKEFIPNSVKFNTNKYIHILTGPNMSGKSTYIRQVALLVLLAQIGSFVPATKMKWNIVDRIFTRVGASDNLAKGESTFMVEMSETANILNNATEQSLVILDEVGRGTSTYDGVAIAWSIIEFIAKKIKSKTLFATHYHELTSLDANYKQIDNYNVKVIEKGGDIIFQHKIIPGSADKSYGVHVAKIAGVPGEVVDRANEILSSFESESKVNISAKKQNSSLKSPISKSVPQRPKKIHPEQLGLI